MIRIIIDFDIAGFRRQRSLKRFEGPENLYDIKRDFRESRKLDRARYRILIDAYKAVRLKCRPAFPVALPAERGNKSLRYDITSSSVPMPMKRVLFKGACEPCKRV